MLLAEEPEHLADCLAVATRERRPLVEVERERRGATHAEVGAHLLELWGLPHELVEAVAFHHRAPELPHPVFDATAAVAIAAALLDELDESRAHPPCLAALDQDYLETLGVAGRLPLWREHARTVSLVTG